jgi:hypothetical protein
LEVIWLISSKSILLSSLTKSRQDADTTNQIYETDMLPTLFLTSDFIN